MNAYIKTPIIKLLDKYFTGSSMNYKQIFSMIFPIFLDSLFIVLISILNTAMVSSSGVAAVSAVSMVDSINIFIVSVFIAISTGGTVIVAQYTGKREAAQASNAASQAVSSVTTLSLVICLLVIVFHTPILNFLFGSAEHEVINNAKLFLIGSAISYPFLGLYQAVIGALRGVSETKACLVLSIILNLSYFILNLVFITWLDMGVLGLAISLITARVLGAASALFYLFRYNHTLHCTIKNMFKLQLSLLKKIMFIGLPFAMEQLFFNGGKLLTQTFIVQFGTLSITVNAISNSLSMLLQVGGNTISVAIVTVVGQCLGRRDIEDAKKFIRSFLWLSSILFILITAIILLIFPWLVSLYSPPKEIVPNILQLIILLSVAQPIVWSLSFILPSALRAAGDSKFTSITSLLTMWLFRVILGYILGVSLGYGLLGVWVAMVAEWAIRGIIFYLRYRGSAWYKHKLV